MNPATIATAAKYAIIAGLGLYAYHKVSTVGGSIVSGIRGAIPEVAIEGVQATGQIAGNVFNIVTNPFDAFGIAPAAGSGGRNYWEKTVPWENTNDPVSNNDAGVNWNYF